MRKLRNNNKKQIQTQTIILIIFRLTKLYVTLLFVRKNNNNNHNHKMETPLTARDFLLRFHLPQLVKLANVADNKLQQQSTSKSLRPNDRLSNANDATILSSSRSEKRSKWTYLEPEYIEANASSQRDIYHSKGSQTTASSTSSATSHSNIITAENYDYHSQNEHQQQQQQREMMSLMVELPRVSLSKKHHYLQQSKSRQSLCNQAATPAIGKPNYYCNKTNNAKIHTTTSSKDIDHNILDAGSLSYASIRLCPPSKRPLFSKLALNQPFLLYKARKKVEMSAYVLDRRNELNQRSGQPIYFPIEYSGKFERVKYELVT